MTSTLSRSQAKTWTLIAQIASGVCVLGAVGVGVVGLPQPTPGAALEEAKANAWPIGGPGATPGNNAGAENEPGQTPATQVDTTGLAARFALLDNAPIPVDNSTPEPEEVEQPDGPDGGPDDGEIAKRVRYIGFINDPSTRHAFIRIDGKQRIVAQGSVAKSANEEFADLRVERITPDRIVLSDGQKRASVPLAAKSAQSITMIDGGSVDVADSAQENPSGGLTKEDEEYIASLPPRQQPSARRRLERERRGLPATNPNRRRPPEPQATYRGTLNRSSNRESRDD